MNSYREPRRLQRTRFTAEQHFDALDADADNHEIAMEDLKQELHSIRSVLIGLMVAIAGGAVVGALNILLKV